MIDISTLSDEQLKQALAPYNTSPYRVKQIRQWLARGVSSFDSMTDLPAALRVQLSILFSLPATDTPTAACIVRKGVSRDGTIKYLFEYPDGARVESVLMSYKHGLSQCLSTQAGCRMGCGFCATGRGGFRRDLTAPEMTAQIVAAQRDTGHRVSSLVLMGMGEPLDNYDNTLRFLRSLSGEPAHGGVPAVRIGMRHVSLSTCGLVDNIRRLQEEHFALTLSVSLHAPNDGLRSRLMPVTKKWPVDALLAACGEYAGATGRRVSFEYALIADFNDTDACARQLAAKLRGYMDLPLCHVNLIPVNPVDGSPWQKSTRTRAFQALLEQAHIPVTVRRTLGADIAASCGQLRNAECGMRNAE